MSALLRTVALAAGIPTGAIGGLLAVRGRAR